MFLKRLCHPSKEQNTGFVIGVGVCVLVVVACVMNCVVDETQKDKVDG